jgi:hypothetical protein
VGHARGFSGARTRLQTRLQGGGVLEPWAPSDFLRKSWEILEPVAKFWESPAGNSGKFWDFCIIRRHRSRVHQSRPEKRRDLRHVTQPRARVNVSCSRAGHKGPQQEASEEGWVPDLGGSAGLGYFLS